jgi:hypothetical protein
MIYKMKGNWPRLNCVALMNALKLNYFMNNPFQGEDFNFAFRFQNPFPWKGQGEATAYKSSGLYSKCMVS